MYGLPVSCLYLHHCEHHKHRGELLLEFALEQN